MTNDQIKSGGELDLRPWGYAPGGYFFKCIDCPETSIPLEWPIADKRSWRCKEHALVAREKTGDTLSRTPSHGRVSDSEDGRLPDGTGLPMNGAGQDVSAVPVGIPNVWQAIDTAPRDGTRVLLWCIKTAGEVGGTTECAMDYIGEFWGGGSDYPGNNWWVIASDTYANWAWPTHWMPLPAPPQGMETRQGGDGEAAPSRSDDSPVGHQADAPKGINSADTLSTQPETVAAPIPVEGEVIQADRDLLASILRMSEYDKIVLDKGLTYTGEVQEIARHRLTFSRGVDEVREEGERAKIVAWLRAHEHTGYVDEPFDEAAEAIEREDHLTHAARQSLSTIEEPRG